MLNFQYKPIDNQQKSDCKSIIRYHNLKNQQMIINILEDVNLQKLIEQTNFVLSSHLHQILTSEYNGHYLIDLYNADHIQSRLYGLELHKLKECFAQGEDYISKELFVIIMFKLLFPSPEEAPYFLNGIRELYDIIDKQKDNNLSQMKNLSKKDLQVYMEIKMIKFEDFLNNYMSFTSSEKNEVNEKETQLDIYQIVEAKNQDKYLHKHEIKKVIYARNLEILSLTEDQLSEILLFNKNIQNFHKLSFNVALHNSATLIILDFNYSEANKEFACTLQDHSISFWNANEKFLKERVLNSNKMHLKIIYIELLKTWVTINTSNQIIIWNIPKKEENMQSQNQFNLIVLIYYLIKVRSKILWKQLIEIQFAFRLMRKRFIYIMVHQKRKCQFFLMFQYFKGRPSIILKLSVNFNIVNQSFFTIHFNNYIQTWLLEETNTDYTKDRKLTICKQEQMVLSFEFIMNSSILVTFDSGGSLKAFDCLTYRMIGQYYKMFKKTSQIRIVELQYSYFALVGNRMYIFNIHQKNMKNLIKQRNYQSLQNLNEKQQLQLPQIDSNEKSKALEDSKILASNLMDYVRKLRKATIKKKMTIKQIDQKNMFQEILDQTNRKIKSQSTVQEQKVKVPIEDQYTVDIENELNNLTQKQFFQHQNRDGYNTSGREKEKIQQIRDDFNETPQNKIRKLLQNDHLKSLYNLLSKVDKKSEFYEDLMNPQKKQFPLQNRKYK